MACMIRSHHSCGPSGEKKPTKPKWRQPYHGHLTLNATPFWSNMCFIVALMDLRFRGFWVYWFISYTLSSEGYCWPAWNVRRCSRYRYYEWFRLFLNAASSEAWSISHKSFSIKISFLWTALVHLRTLFRCVCMCVFVFECDLWTIIWSVCLVAQFSLIKIWRFVPLAGNLSGAKKSPWTKSNGVINICKLDST